VFSPISSYAKKGLQPDTTLVTLLSMIKKIKHKGLRTLFESGGASGIQLQHAKRLRQILALLETADTISDMDLPGLNSHELKGQRKATHAVKVSGNWRVTFKIINGDILDVDYADYH
jgi:proteic killer suppression protein